MIADTKARRERWRNVRLRFVAEINPMPPGRTELRDDDDVSFLPMEAIGEDGSIRAEIVRSVDELRAGYSFFADGDIAFAKVTPCFENGKGALMRGLVGGLGFGSTELTVLRPKAALAGRFLHYFLTSPRFRGPGAGAMTGAGGLKRVPEEFTRNALIPLPPMAEQIAIADFLDHETARIDALIERKNRFIELLREKRQAVICAALSGTERRPLKHVTLFMTSGPRGWSDRISGGGDSIFVQSGDLTDELGIDYNSASRIAVENDAEAARTRLAEGDVVVCITGAKTGRVALASAPPNAAYVNQHLCLVRPDPEKVVPAYLALVLHSRIGRDHFDVRQYGLKEGLSLADVGDTPIPLPALEEQRAAVRSVTERTAAIERTVAVASKSVDLLRERRTALITAAVTGQIDVREAA